MIHSVRMASITTPPPGGGARRRRRWDGRSATLAPERYSWAPAVACRKASSSDAVCGDSSWSTDPVRAAELADRSIARPRTSMPSGPRRVSAAAGLAQLLGERGRCGRADPHPARGVAVDELVDRALLDQPAAADDDEVVGHQRHLRQQVAADEHRLALPGEVHEHVADPADALGVEPVGRLVEDHGVRVAEQHAGQAEPLAHAERVALDLAPGDLGQADQVEALVDARRGDPVRRRQPAQVVATAAARVHVAGVEQRPDLEQRARGSTRSGAVERRRAALGPVEADHAAHRRALARPVGAEEPGDPAGVDVEAEVVDGHRPAEPLGQVADLDHDRPQPAWPVDRQPCVASHSVGDDVRARAASTSICTISSLSVSVSRAALTSSSVAVSVVVDDLGAHERQHGLVGHQRLVVLQRDEALGRDDRHGREQVAAVDLRRR